MRSHFDAEQFLPHPVELVFAFFANPENLPRLMPSWQKARIEQAHIAPPPPLPASLPRPLGTVAGNGTRLTISFRALPLLPIRFPWDALIEDFRWNQGFCDVQERGPFAYWRHCHTVAPAVQNGLPGATVHDHVDYELPLAPLSNLPQRFLMRPQIASIFRYRHQRTAELLSLIARPQAPTPR
jgi:ligand-binding SRPBCC domain-containing protein